MESKKDLARLTPEDCFIPGKPIERVGGQIGQTQKATCEVDGGVNGLPPRAGPSFRSVCDALRCSIRVDIGSVIRPEPCVDNFLQRSLNLAVVPELTIT